MQLLEDVRVEWMGKCSREVWVQLLQSVRKEPMQVGVGFWVIVELVRGGLLWRRGEEGGGGIDVDGIGLESMPVTPMMCCKRRLLLFHVGTAVVCLLVCYNNICVALLPDCIYIYFL